MSGNNEQSRLPFRWTRPPDPRKKRLVRALRVAVCAAFVAALLVPAVQLQVLHVRNRLADDAKEYKGAQARWSVAARRMWAGDNIYRSIPEIVELKEAGKIPRGKRAVALHPNMPFTVILLSAFAYLPWWLGPLLFTVLKLAVVVLAVFAAIAVCNHEDRKMPAWVAALGVAWGLAMIVSDIQHANLNCFSLGAIVLHLWLYRRGRDAAAGGALALAICLKMTPALFLLYWLYQRNGKLLGGCLAALVLAVAVVPAAAIGPDRAVELTGTWMRNLVIEGAGGAWYPVHINQSLQGVLSRYFVGPPHPGGNIFWDADSNPYAYQQQFAWITIVDLGPAATRRLILACGAAITAAMAWAVGLRKLPRRDGRRGLHYGIVVAGMMILNQRTWDHHAAVLLPAYIAAWQAIGFGRFSRRARKLLFGGLMLAGLLVWLSAGELLEVYARLLGFPDEDRGADVLLAWGPRFYAFLILFLVLTALAALLRRAEPPYARNRQTLSGPPA